MKKSIILCILASLLFVPTPANSQFEAIVSMGLSLLGIGGGKDPYAKARLVELKKILDKNKKELAKLARIEESSQGTELYTQAQLEISRSVEELMRSVSELKAIRSRDGQIRFNDLVVFNQIQQEVNQYLSGYVSAAFLKQLEKQIVNGAARNHTLAQNSGSNIYDLFFGKSGLDARQPANLTDLGTARGEEALHLLQFQTAAQKKKIVQSLLYYKLADELYAQSITLNNALNDEQNGTALDIARRLRQTITQRMSQSSLQDLISDPPNIGSGFDLMSLGGMGGMPEEMAGMFQKMLDQVNNDAQSFLSNMDGAFQNPQITDPMAPDMGYFSEQNSPRGLRLTTGERASLQKSAMDMATQAVEYRRKGDALMEESLEKTPLQQVLEMKRARTYMQESYRYLDLSL